MNLIKENISRIRDIRYSLRDTFKDVTFYDENHEYLHKDLGKFISMTTLIGKYETEFPFDMQAERYALKHGFLVEKVKELWTWQNVYSTLTGSYIHDAMEVYYNQIIDGIYDIVLEEILNSQPFKERLYEIQDYEIKVPITILKDVIRINRNKTDNRGRIPILVNFAKKFIADTKDILLPISTEQIVYDQDFRLSGKFDITFYHLIKKYCIVTDWKTNSDFKIENKFQSFHAPLEHLQETHYNAYRLQTTGYRYCVSKKIPDLVFSEKNMVIHFSERNKDYIKYPMDYVKDDFQKLLNHYKENYLDKNNLLFG